MVTLLSHTNHQHGMRVFCLSGWTGRLNKDIVIRPRV